MEIEVSTNNSLHGGESLTRLVRGIVENPLSHLSSRITRLLAHVEDVNSHKGGDVDKRCSLEAHVKGLKPIAVSNHAGTYEVAIEGAVRKLKRSIESTLGKMGDQRPEVPG